MDIARPAIAGTLESSDAQVSVQPDPTGLDVSIQSTVANRYGRQVKAAVMDALQRLDVRTGRVTVIDKGALDATLKARVECAVLRSNDASAAGVDWGGMIR